VGQQISETGNVNISDGEYWPSVYSGCYLDVI
jgi:hypothetical protein